VRVLTRSWQAFLILGDKASLGSSKVGRHSVGWIHTIHGVDSVSRALSEWGG